MLCENCGKEIEEGSVYCNYCGRPVQIVPDYNVLDEDILPRIIEDPAERKRRLLEKKQKEAGQNNEKLSLEGQRKNRQKRIFLIGGLIAIGLLLSVLLFVHIFSYRYNMFRGGTAAQEEDYETAIFFYERAISEEHPIIPLVNIANVEYLCGHYEEAVSILEELIKEHSGDKRIGDAYKQLVMIYGATGNYESLRRLAAHPPNDEIAALFSEYVLSKVRFSKNGGTYTDDISLTLKPDEGSCRIYYTLDGKDPDITDGILYEEPLLITDGTTTVKAVCVDGNGRKGEIFSETYTVHYDAPDRPTASPRGGTFLKATRVTLTAEEGTKIYYTWNGKIPSSGSSEYTEPIRVPEGNNILSAIAVDSHGLTSDILRLNYEYLPQTTAVQPQADQTGDETADNSAAEAGGASGSNGSGAAASSAENNGSSNQTETVAAAGTNAGTP